jgi:hypothetical protein
MFLRQAGPSRISVRRLFLRRNSFATGRRRGLPERRPLLNVCVVSSIPLSSQPADDSGFAMYVDPDKLNAELSPRLRGCVLICELDIDEPLHRRLVAAMQVLRERGVTWEKKRLRRYPALVATYLVAEGIFSFERGTFWPNLSVDGLDREALTDVFEHALAIYVGLERFRALLDAGALRYVAPILAHGGIPRYSLPDFFHLLFEADRRGAADAAEMLAYWREHPSAFAHFDKCVERFLVHGGDISVDFLDRCLDLIRSHPDSTADLPPDRFGLPTYVCEAFVALAPADRRFRTSVTGESALGGVPRPYIFVDPWDASGPMLVIPALPASFRDGSWDLVSKESAARYAASRAERVVPLSPALHWGVEFRPDVSAAPRAFTFPGVARTGALLFDYEDGRLVTDLTRLRGSSVWILRAAGDEGAVRGAGGTALLPFDSAPAPAGAWDGFSLDAYDLSETERLTIGKSNHQPGGESSSALWVRIRGERIALAGAPVDAVRTDDGLPVYANVPALILPGFAPGAVNGAGLTGVWFVRVSSDGVEHTFDTAALSAVGSEVIRSVIDPTKITRVEVTARGPLGMDMRATFCVVPRLSIDRPTGVLLPSRRSAQPLGHVTVRDSTDVVHKIDVHSGVDAVAAHVRDPSGVAVRLQITVPCLQWALAVQNGPRGDLGQQPARLSSHALLSTGSALLLVRTRRPNVPVRLEIRSSGTVVQTIDASTRGDEGRWAFDLRRFSSTVQSSTESLPLVLVVNGFDVDVGVIRAELEIAGLTVHQRIVPDHVSITLTWQEARALRNRVARLWPLSLPWRAPIVTEISDDARGEVTMSGSEDDIPPGCYLAEVAIDDGWTAVRRPAFDSIATRQFRLGTDDDEKRWLAHQHYDDPFSVLANASIHGRTSRPLTDDEVELVTPAALEALWVIREQGGAMVAPGTVTAIARLVASAPEALARGVEAAAIDWDAGHESPIIAPVLDVLPQLSEWVVVRPPVGETEKLWALCPPLAAALDLPHANVLTVRARCENGLGTSLDEALTREVVPSTRGRSPALQMFENMPVEALEALRRACSLVPKRPLDLDTQAATHFEWLIADKRNLFSAKQWASMYRSLVTRSTELPLRLAHGFDAIRAPENWASIFPALCFPETVYVAALHVVAGTPCAVRAAGALRELIPVCPAIVSRSLVLATVHAHLAN